MTACLTTSLPTVIKRFLLTGMFLLSFESWGEGKLFNDGEVLVPAKVENAIISVVKDEIEKVVSTNLFWIDRLSFRFSSTTGEFKGSLVFNPLESGGAKEVGACFYSPDHETLSCEAKTGNVPKDISVIKEYISSFLNRDDKEISDLKISWHAVTDNNVAYKGYIQINPDGSIEESFFGTL